MQNPKLTYKEYKALNEKLSKAKKKLENSEYKLKERVKELQGIYSLGLLAESCDKLEDVFDEFVNNIVPESMQFPDKVYVLLDVDKQSYTNNKKYKLKKNKKYLSQQINVLGMQSGKLIVTYTDDLPFIEIFEQKLIDAYAERLSKIIERLRAEKELRKQSYRLSKVQELGIISSWEMDVKNNILLWTEENHIIFGIPIYSELSYEIFLKQVHPDDRSYVDQKWKSALNGNEIYDIKYRIIVNNNIKWLRQKADLIFDSKGDCTRAIGFTQDITEQKNTDQKIREAIIKTEEDERERFSKDLHDGLGALLSSINLYLGYLNSDHFDETEKKNFIKYAEELIQEAIVTTKEIANNIKPVRIERFGLISTLSKYFDHVMKTGVFKINFSADIDDNILSKEQEIAVYRILLELLNNSIKHSGAKNVTINLNLIDNKIVLKYTDNGKGFNPDDDKKQQGLGLINITNRVNALRGTININSSEGKGVEILILFKN